MRFDPFGPTGGDGIPAVAYQLADHLDAALAAAEDLAEAGRQWVPAQAQTGHELAAQFAAERQVIERVRMFETVLIGRVLKARKRAQALTREAGDFAGMTRLFVGGTAPLLDAVEELGDSTRKDFETADCATAYLRARGVIDAEAADLPEDRMISLGDDAFLVAGRIALGPLTEMISAFLDALDAHYDLYPDDDGGDGEAAFAWGDVVAAARGAHSDADAAGGAARDTGEAGAADQVDAAHTDAANTADTADAAGAAAGTRGADMPPAPPAPAPSGVVTPPAPLKARSLVERLNEVARQLE